MPYFVLKTPPESVFPHGIFIPYATEKEALEQAAWDLRETDDRFEGLYRVAGKHHLEFDDERSAAVLVNVLGAGDTVTPDDVPYKPSDRLEKLHTAKQLQTQAKKIQQELIGKSVEAETQRIEQIHRITVAIAEGSFEKLSEKDQKMAIALGIVPQNIAGRGGYSVCSGGTATAGAIALTAATAKTVLGIAGGANSPAVVSEVAISFDGVTASAVPVLCESVSGTNATNPPGTNSTSMTPKKTRGGDVGPAVSTAAYNWTAEPTVLECYKKRLLTPNGGLLVIQYPLDREPVGIVTAATQFKFLGWRLTAPATVNCHVDAEFDE